MAMSTLCFQEPTYMYISHSFAGPDPQRIGLVKYVSYLQHQHITGSEGETGMTAKYNTRLGLHVLYYKQRDYLAKAQATHPHYCFDHLSSKQIH